MGPRGAGMRVGSTRTTANSELIVSTVQPTTTNPARRLALRPNVAVALQPAAMFASQITASENPMSLRLYRSSAAMAISRFSIESSRVINTVQHACDIGPHIAVSSFKRPDQFAEHDPVHITRILGRAVLPQEFFRKPGLARIVLHEVADQKICVEADHVSVAPRAMPSSISSVAARFGFGRMPPRSRMLIEAGEASASVALSSTRRTLPPLSTPNVFRTSFGKVVWPFAETVRSNSRTLGGVAE